MERRHLYVTFVEKEGPFIKLWGQTDKNNALYVEKILTDFAPQFDAGLGKVPVETIPPGTLICAKYKDGKYYRAKILNSVYVREGTLEVSFIDFGNKELVSSDAVRTLQHFPPPLVSIPPLAIGFIFAEAHCVGGGEWNDTIFDSIAKEMKYRECSCIILAQATNYYLVRIFVEGADLCSILIQKGLMQPISLQAQQAVLLSMSMQKPSEQSSVQAPNTSPPQINTYKACTLEPGCQYPVYVSYVNDGPCHFSIQLKQTEDILVKLMNEINIINLRLLDDIPIPGTICLARCIEDGNICRAVVTNEVDTQFKIFYVDFGNYEVLPLESLYQIPFKYVLPKVMAIRFALNGIEKSAVTIDMQIAFKKFVDNRLLHMKVLPSPTRTALPKCELWDPETKTSALDVVIRSASHSYPEPMALTRGFSQPVKVSFVYSCSRFYVQLVNKEPELTALMDELQPICEASEMLNPDSIKEGLPCCALFSADELWYRSEIVELGGDVVKVRYIDYGNEEYVPLNQLKSIRGEILTVLRPQAIESCLNGYQNMEPDVERDGLLEELILEGVFTMKVVDMFNKKTLVDLFDSSNYNVASLLLDKLAAANSQISPVLAVQAGNKIEHRKSFAKPRDPQNFDKGDRNFNTGREHKTWDRSNSKNDRTEKSWRQDSRENKTYDKDTNENTDRNWRQNNKGFRKQDDSWNSTENAVNNNDDWGGKAQKSPETNTGWNDSSSKTQDSWNAQGSNDTWGSNNPDDSRPKRNDFGGGFNNDRGGRFGGKPRDRDGGFRDRDGGFKDRGGGFKDRDGGFKDRDGGFKKREFRKEGTELSSSESEKSFHKGPRSSSRIDRGRGGRNFDKPRDSSYRDNRNGGGDSWNTNANTDSWKGNTATDDSWNVSSVAPSIDAAPPTAVFNNYDVVGTEGNIVISWFHNPGLFYCQQVSTQEAFKTMMEEICEFYKDKKPEPAVKGAPVIALFDEDKVLYRARVLRVAGTQYKVHYVDFGNVSMVSKIYPIEKRFMDLPVQSIPCAMNGIVPVNEQWDDADRYGSYFNKDNFYCQYVNKDEEKIFVNIYLDSEDIGKLLVRDGLAVSTESVVPDIEISILLGQQFRATVKSVNNLSDIILALECGLAINCTMHNLETATETFEDTLKGLLEQAVIVYVDNVLEDYRLEITLYDTEGNKLVILNPDEGSYETVDIPCPMLVLRSVISGYVSFANDMSVFIQPSEYEDNLAFLLDQLFEEYDGKEHENTIIPEEGMIYAVHSEDGNWYRGKVIIFDDEKATVNYIDYGNSEDVAFVELRELATKFFDIAILSLQIAISDGGEAFVDKTVTANIYYGDAGWEGTIQLLEASSTTLVAQPENIESSDSVDTGVGTSSIEKPDLQELPLQEESSEVVETDFTTESESVQDPAEPTASKQSLENQVFMSHIDSPNDFYLQFHKTLGEIDALQAELQEMVHEMIDLENPAPGVLCAAPYSADQQWYRAEVLDADEDITTVRFVDFGNTDVIDNKSTKVKTLPQKFLSLAIYATRCSLKIQPVDDEWSSTPLTVFEQLTIGENLTAEFLEQDEKCTYVELYIDAVNIKDAMIKENIARPVTTSTESKQTGFVSHLNSPSEFWIQLENCVDELEWIAEQLSTAEKFEEIEDLTPGTLCAALFPDDQMWYRARILSNTVAGIELLFIDYGNSCTSSSLRQLPEDLVMTAPLALKCSLQKNEGIPTWSPEAAAKFAEISADGQTIFNVKKISSGETSVVQLLLNGQDVTTMLLPTTEEGLVKEIQTLEKLTIEKKDGEIVDEVALEPLEGQTWDENAKEKLEELNEQGTTQFQIEFINQKTIRLYLDGKDIRPRLAPFSVSVLESQKFDGLNDAAQLHTEQSDILQTKEIIQEPDLTQSILVNDRLSDNIQAHNSDQTELLGNVEAEFKPVPEEYAEDSSNKEYSVPLEDAATQNNVDIPLPDNDLQTKVEEDSYPEDSEKTLDLTDNEQIKDVAQDVIEESEHLPLSPTKELDVTSDIKLIKSVEDKEKLVDEDSSISGPEEYPKDSCEIRRTEEVLPLEDSYPKDSEKTLDLTDNEQIKEDVTQDVIKESEHLLLSPIKELVTSGTELIKSVQDKEKLVDEDYSISDPEEYSKDSCEIPRTEEALPLEDSYSKDSEKTLDLTDYEQIKEDVAQDVIEESEYLPLPPIKELDVASDTELLKSVKDKEKLVDKDSSISGPEECPKDLKEAEEVLPCLEDDLQSGSSFNKDTVAEDIFEDAESSSLKPINVEEVVSSDDPEILKTTLDAKEHIDDFSPTDILEVNIEENTADILEVYENKETLTSENIESKNLLEPENAFNESLDETITVSSEENFLDVSSHLEDDIFDDVSSSPKSCHDEGISEDEPKDVESSIITEINITGQTPREFLQQYETFVSAANTVGDEEFICSDSDSEKQTVEKDVEIPVATGCNINEQSSNNFFETVLSSENTVNNERFISLDSDSDSEKQPLSFKDLEKLASAGYSLTGLSLNEMKKLSKTSISSKIKDCELMEDVSTHDSPPTDLVDKSFSSQTNVIVEQISSGLESEKPLECLKNIKDVFVLDLPPLVSSDSEDLSEIEDKLTILHDGKNSLSTETETILLEQDEINLDQNELVEQIVEKKNLKTRIKEDIDSTDLETSCTLFEDADKNKESPLENNTSSIQSQEIANDVRVETDTLSNSKDAKSTTDVESQRFSQEIDTDQKESKKDVEIILLTGDIKDLLPPSTCSEHSPDLKNDDKVIPKSLSEESDIQCFKEDPEITEAPSDLKINDTQLTSTIVKDDVSDIVESEETVRTSLEPIIADQNIVENQIVESIETNGQDLLVNDTSLDKTETELDDISLRKDKSVSEMSSVKKENENTKKLPVTDLSFKETEEVLPCLDDVDTGSTCDKEDTLPEDVLFKDADSSSSELPDEKDVTTKQLTPEKAENSPITKTVKQKISSPSAKVSSTKEKQGISPPKNVKSSKRLEMSNTEKKSKENKIGFVPINKQTKGLKSPIKKETPKENDVNQTISPVKETKTSSRIASSSDSAGSNKTTSGATAILPKTEDKGNKSPSTKTAPLKTSLGLSKSLSPKKKAADKSPKCDAPVKEMSPRTNPKKLSYSKTDEKQGSKNAEVGISDAKNEPDESVTDFVTADEERK